MARAAVSVTVATGETPAISVIRSSTTTPSAVYVRPNHNYLVIK